MDWERKIIDKNIHGIASPSELRGGHEDKDTAEQLGNFSRMEPFALIFNFNRSVLGNRVQLFKHNNTSAQGFHKSAADWPNTPQTGKDKDGTG